MTSSPKTRGGRTAPRMVTGLVAAATLVGMTGAFLSTPVPSRAMDAAGSATDTVAVHTIAYTTPLHPASAISRGVRSSADGPSGSGGGSGGDQPNCLQTSGGSAVCEIASSAAKSAASGSGSGSGEAQTASAGSTGSGTDILDWLAKMATNFVKPVADAVTSVGGAVKSVADDVPSVASAGSAIGNAVGSFLHSVGQ